MMSEPSVGASKEAKEGSLDAPTRHPIDWQNPSFYDEGSLFTELERVYDICHGCRRCFNLCQAFPTLFDLIDESTSMELDGVAKADYWKVVDHCYLCDMCFMSKCPYVPPHEWNVDFPHLMLRAKAVKHQNGKTSMRDKIMSATDTVGALASIPVVSSAVNAVNALAPARVVLEHTLGVHRGATLPKYQSPTLRQRLAKRESVQATIEATANTTGKVVLFTTCYGNYNDAHLGDDLVAVFEHNNIAVRLFDKERCCGMPKLELGDLQAVARAKEINIPALAELVDAGYDVVAPIPSCVLMFKQELPLMFPDDAQVAKVQRAMFDPFEYLMLRHRDGKLKTDFKNSLGTVAYHAACHQRVQNIGPRTKETLELVPETTVTAIERCSGHDGTYAVKREFHESSMKIVRPVVRQVEASSAEHYTSDCVMAGHHIRNAMGEHTGELLAPLTLLRKAYGI
ncbi:MAG: glycerol-3-phosphate dehydrogenase subunit C [Gammaproteobacteria bacterium]|jgi:glycerol-3-phosphate dehydrogenase subunit C